MSETPPPPADANVANASAPPAKPKPPAVVQVTWAGGHRFDGGRPNGPAVRMDADGVTGPSPVDTLLNAFAGCAATDVVDILAKRRTPVTALTVDVVGQRVSTVPHRLAHVSLTFTLRGDTIERAQAERAIELAVTKYCSVGGSLREDIPVEWTLVLEPETAA